MSVPYAEVIGDPIGHSKSPLIHQFWLEKTGLPGEYRKIGVRQAGLEAYFAARRADEDWLGCNVTLPHKQSVAPFLDRLDPAAEKIGAVNAIVREGRDLVGYNSDAAGFLEPLQPLLRRRHLYRIARIFGAGGAARAIAHALWQEGFTLVIVARDVDKAERLRGRFDPGHSHVGALSDFAVPTDFEFDDRHGILDLVVNATSLGMAGQPPLELDFSHIPPGAVVYDIVYSPLETPLLAEAKARGLQTYDGLGMLIGQATIAFEKLFGTAAPRAHDAQLRELLTR